MIDPMVSLAFSVYSNKGAYALLLGSGISRASEIPTGWEVVLDLIRKVAKLEGEDCEPDPAAWFKQEHATDPDYGKLLDVIAKTPTERQQLLRSYFEPNEEERAQGLKSPSSGHKAIAQLVATGYARVIITTNFDRLIEKALEEVGVAPSVISTPDQVAGALPLTHSGATLIKLHGDYLDTRIKNTESELATYDPALSSLLDRVVDEYGLIVCGWSADWDIALRAAIERCPSRRFTTYWATRSPLAGQAKRLVDHRKAQVIQVRDGNQFFEGLWVKVRALGDMAAPHPLSAKMAVAAVKRYLVDPAAKIRLRDLVVDETEKTIAEVNAPTFSAETRLPPADELNKRLILYEGLCETLLAIVITGCYWGDEAHAKIWMDCLERIANSAKSESGLTYLLSLRRYPALLLLYGSGIAAIAAGNYQNFASIATRAKVRNDREEKDSICSVVYPIRVMENEVGHLLPALDKHYTPISDYLFSKLRLPLREYLPGEEEYQTAFDRFEYLFGLIHADKNRREVQNGWWGPVGRFAWRGQRFGGDRATNTIQAEIEAQGSNWGPLKAGLFGGSLEQAKQAKAKFDVFISILPFH
ncbi:MAG: SIR2 family protein [Verrucomicrobia bacterium]|nr:SIR2 family protein [Verrucomicrobiota bacterium]